MPASSTDQGGLRDGIAVIGLGKMGGPMARNLVAAGYRVVGFDVDQDRRGQAAANGVEVVDSPAEAATSTGAALVVVGVEDQVRSVVADAEEGLAATAAPGYVVAICSTVEPSCSTGLEALLAPSGIRVVDATLCRGEPSAEDGSLLVLCGGDRVALALLDPVLREVGSDVVRVGETGAGQVAKMLNNYLLWASVVANYEALRLGGRLGLDLDELRGALMLSSGNNWALETWERARPMPWAEDDMRILEAYAKDSGLRMPNAAVVQRLIAEIKSVKNGWTQGGGAGASMGDFTRAHL